uniref:DUF4365 domain-containing protein n=1 Tax=Eubacterium cellulosolvens TaxID=29322 RepID=UPI00048A3275|nr:DUF4365 domain-containing protein [[Eubacterium] cellulosolvens]
MCQLPGDVSARAVCTRSRGIFAYQIDSEHWEWHEQTGTDHGTDIILELSDGNNFLGRQIFGQIKGRTSIKYVDNNDQQMISFPLDVRTINYALNNPAPFVLFLVDVREETVYYLTIQDYFIEHPEYFEKLRINRRNLTLYIDPNNSLTANPEELIAIASIVYVNDNGLRRA